MAHLAATEIDYRNKLEKFLDANDVDRSAPASQETLNKLKIIFKEYWERSAQWAEFVTEETIAQWEGSEYKGLLSISQEGYIQKSDGGKDYGVTNPINGKVLLSMNRSNYGLASIFIHEMVHSMDVMSGVQGFWDHFSIGHDYIEARAYLEDAKWTGGVFSTVGRNHTFNAMPVLLSQFNFMR